MQIGMRHSASFGRIPNPPEPPSDEWYEEHCPRCKYNHEWTENGKNYGECTCPNGACEFEEVEDEE